MEDTPQVINTGCLGFVEMNCKVKAGGGRKGEQWRKEMINKRGKLVKERKRERGRREGRKEGHCMSVMAFACTKKWMKKCSIKCDSCN